MKQELRKLFNKLQILLVTFFFHFFFGKISVHNSMDSALMYSAVASGDVDVISAFSTDGRIAAFDLRLLEDDLGVIPPYDAVVLVSARLAEEAPDVVDALAALGERIDATAMQRMNLAVDEGGLTPAEVARRFRSGEPLSGA